MKIQYVGLSTLNMEKTDRLLDITQSTFREPRDLDDFNLNYIDLNYPDIWMTLPTYSKIPSQYASDFATLRSMLMKTKSKVLISFPQSPIAQYSIKDFLKDFYKAFSILSPYEVDIIYGKTTTKINGTEAVSDFSFNRNHPDFNIVTSSVNSNKPTTISNNNIYFTTLKIEDYEHLKSFLVQAKLVFLDNEEIPSWMEDVKMFDDETQSQKIIMSEKKIEEIQKEIKISIDKLNDNQRLKSILYTQSDELVSVVFEIFEEILGVDLSKFEDKKIEDIAFQVENKTFIGEIKGITSNVKTSNLSQLDNHFTNFIEAHPEISEESIYKILIINHQRKRSIDNRDPVDNKQIEAAIKKYGSLIIETKELLKVLEKYRSGDITREKILELLTQTGIFSL